MKRTPLILLIVSLLLIFGTATVFAAGQNQDNSPFTIESLSPDTPYPGQEVIGTITYDDTATLSGKTVKYEVSYAIATEGVEGTAVCPGNDCSFVADESGTSTINFYAPDAEGTYKLTISLTVDENALQQKLSPKPLVVETALPAGLAQLFAGLGLFAAIMAIMAVGTEVVIETMKMFLGFKSKVTAMEAFDELKTELPGMLAGVGVDSDAREKVSELVDGTGKFLKPINDISGIYKNLTEGSFVAAYKALEKLRDNKDATKIIELKEDAKNKIKEGLEQLRTKLKLDSSLTKTAEKYILDLVDKVPDKITDEQINDIFDTLRTIFTDKNKVEKWLLSQMDTYITQGEEGLMTLLGEAKEEIRKLGFESSELDTWLDQAVVAVGHTAHEKAEVFAHSVRNLLERVEERRSQMQSPFRKLWRRLRNSHLLGGFYYVVPMFILLPALVWGVFHISPLNLLEDVTWQIYWGDAILLGLGFTILVFLVLGAALLAVRKTISPEPKKNDPAKWTLGYVLRYFIERPFNIIIGHASSVEDAANYGQADSDLVEIVKSTRPTTIASTLLALENKHKDEETSRIRWMRIFSIVIGIILAYHLKVDAATYLGYAVPKVDATINSINLNNSTFVQYWFPKGLTIGMILTGFAASAGSKFWRDLLGRLQATRGQAEEAAQVVRKVKSTISELK